MTKDVLIPVVNEDDEIIGYKLRSQIEIKDIYRISALWMENSNGDVLLAQRSMLKKHDPGCWSEAVIGTVEKDETYEISITKEIEEELGIKDIKVMLGPKIRFYEPRHLFCQLFYTSVDLPLDAFSIQLEEVSQVMWVPKFQLFEDYKINPQRYVPGFDIILSAVSIDNPGLNPF